MTEIILFIEETNFKETKDSWLGYDGYRITTDKQIILFGISDGQSCCESFGYFSTPDEIQEFVGAELLDVKKTDTALNTETLKKHCEYGFDCGGVMFVTFETSKGTLQFAAYNAHNGYYGHTAIIRSLQLNDEESL